MKIEGYDCIAVVPGPNLHYITSKRFHLSERPVVLFIEQDALTFILPELESQKVSDIDVDFLTYSDVTGPGKAFDKFFEDHRFDKIGVESRIIRHLELNLIDRNNVGIYDAMSIFANLRTKKSEAEMQQCKRNIKRMKREKGCTESLYGMKSRCVIVTLPADGPKCDSFMMDDKCRLKRA